MENIVINVDALKNNYEDDPLSFHIWYIAIDCKRRRDAYWRHYERMKIKSNIVSIPLLILTSATGLTSVANLSTESSSLSNAVALPAIVTVFGVSSAILSALQKYFRYSERSEHSKHMAKAYGRIARRIENTMIMLKSKATSFDPETFQKFVEEVQKDTESLSQETDDVPRELLNDKNVYHKMIDSMKTNVSHFLPPSNSKIGSDSNNIQDINDSPDIMNIASNEKNDLQSSVINRDINVTDLETIARSVMRVAPLSDIVENYPNQIDFKKDEKKECNDNVVTSNKIKELQDKWLHAQTIKNELERLEAEYDKTYSNNGSEDKIKELNIVISDLKNQIKVIFEDINEFTKINKLEYLWQIGLLSKPLFK